MPINPYALVALVAFSAPALAQTMLDDYIAKKDPTFAWRIESERSLGAGKAVVAELTSQTWRGKPWTHWLTMIVPSNLKHRDAAVLLIGGGANGDEAPKLDGARAVGAAALAEHIGVPIVILQQTPNQPLLRGLHEDELIAETFQQYLRTGDSEWPLLLPMTKSAVAAMDAAQAIAGESLGLNVQRFIVTGSSKRGWTTWLAAAVDPRVAGIAPVVIDLLNLPRQVELQEASYGRLADALQAYGGRGLHKAIGTPRADALLAAVDPYSYRDRYTMPKLVVLGTNDPYWVADAANLYFDDLPGPKHLYYEPNAGHGVNSVSLPTMAAFVEATLAGRTLPDVRWEHGDAPGTLNVTWDAMGDLRGQATLWTADAPRRDFRQAQWKETPLTGGGSATARVEKPAKGYRAYFVRVEFAGEPDVALSTAVTVLPE